MTARTPSPLLPVPTTRPPDPIDPTRDDRLLATLERLYGVWLRCVVAATGNRADRRRVDDDLVTLQVVRRSDACADGSVITLDLADPDGGDVPSWFAGAHITLHLPSGRRRQYSLCGDPTDRHHLRIAVRRAAQGAGGSVEVHDGLAVGDTVSVRRPRNAFAFVEPARHESRQRVRFVAGGIGITAIAPMATLAERAGLDWSLMYVGRDRASMAFLDELTRFGDRVAVRTDDASGHPTADDLLPDLVDGDVVYACGPPAMTALIDTRIRHVPGVELHTELFAAPPVVDGRPFRLELSASGRVIEVEGDETALDAVLRDDPRVAYSCRQGFCGTCRVRVTEGEVDHRDSLLTDDQRASGQMLLCVSRAAGRSLTVDL